MNTIEPGLYYHYKHDPLKDISNYAYEVLNIAYHTEMHGKEEGILVVYRPLYESFTYKAGKHWDVRPFFMFMENVIKDGKKIPRFSKITDPSIISELEAIKRKLYD